MLPYPLNESNSRVMPTVLSTLISSNTVETSDVVGISIMPLWLIEKNAIEDAINCCDGNIPKAAALLDVSPSTIYRKKQAWEEL